MTKKKNRGDFLSEFRVHFMNTIIKCIKSDKASFFFLFFGHVARHAMGLWMFTTPCGTNPTAKKMKTWRRIMPIKASFKLLSACHRLILWHGTMQDQLGSSQNTVSTAGCSHCVCTCVSQQKIQSECMKLGGSKEKLKEATPWMTNKLQESRHAGKNVSTWQV